ncbi:MAG TPA: 50S ribosomal protein L35 [Bacillales bacterium]|nr:50S ribosomal protein L35 [Bacillales bacterium]HEU5138329.1 50S ribosomal protein L35 [Bacillales bacterium]
MPKMKTHKGAAKRFKKTGTGKVKRNHAFTSHFFRHKSQKQKRKLRKGAMVAKSDEKNIKRLLNS